MKKSNFLALILVGLILSSTPVVAKQCPCVQMKKKLRAQRNRKVNKIVALTNKKAHAKERVLAQKRAQTKQR